MAVMVAQIHDLVMEEVDDPTAIRLPEPLFLRMLTRAQQWVTLRYQLLRETILFQALTNVPVYPLATIAPRQWCALHLTRADGTVLDPVALAHLRYRDLQWFATTGPLQQWYRVGWSFVGLRPVPASTEILRLTGLQAPGAVISLQDFLTIPDSHAVHVALVVAGLLLITSERRYEEGLQRLQRGLGLSRTPPQAVARV